MKGTKNWGLVGKWWKGEHGPWQLENPPLAPLSYLFHLVHILQSMCLDMVCPLYFLVQFANLVLAPFKCLGFISVIGFPYPYIEFLILYILMFCLSIIDFHYSGKALLLLIQP